MRKHGMNAEDWKFRARGGANAVFRFIGEDSFYKGKLLRLRLRKSDEAYVSTKEIYDFMLKSLVILALNNQTIELVTVSKTFLTSLETKDFELMENEPHGLLMPDAVGEEFEQYMLSKSCAIHIHVNPTVYDFVLELKPKWLQHRDALYCRNCCVSQMRGLNRHFCVLDFITPECIEIGLRDFIEKFPSRTRQGTTLEIRSHVCRVLRNLLANPRNIFVRLHDLQRVGFDSSRNKHLKRLEDVTDDVLLAMALRDVTIFIRCTSSKNSSKLTSLEYDLSYMVTDLDLKHKTKFRHWAATEIELEAYSNNRNNSWRPCVKLSKVNT